MDADVHHVVITGTPARNPITRCADHGTQVTNCPLRLDEPGPRGQRFKLFVPLAASGQAGEQAGELSAGEAILVAGRLKQPGPGSGGGGGVPRTAPSVYPLAEPMGSSLRRQPGLPASPLPPHCELSLAARVPEAVLDASWAWLGHQRRDGPRWRRGSMHA